MEDSSKFGNDEIYSKRVRAGRRRTYFFDVRETKGNDYYITITESKRKFEDGGYERHKLHLYKEDFNKFLAAFTDTMQHVKGELLPEYDFDEFSHEDDEDRSDHSTTSVDSESVDNPPKDAAQDSSQEESDSWE